jgi:foldase protein PrsA
MPEQRPSAATPARESGPGDRGQGRRSLRHGSQAPDSRRQRPSKRSPRTQSLLLATTLALTLALSACGSSSPPAKHASTAKSPTASTPTTSTGEGSSSHSASASVNDNPATILLPTGASAGQTLASVAGEPISAAEVARIMAEHSEGPVPDPPNYSACIANLKQAAAAEASSATPAKEQSTAELRQSCQSKYEAGLTAALSRATHNHWLIGEARELGVHVSSRAVQQEFQAGVKSFKTAVEFNAYRKRSGQSVAGIKAELLLGKLSDAIFKVAKSKEHSTTPAEAGAYYRSHPQQFTVPEGRDVRILRTATEASALKAKQEIQSGKSFSSVASEFSSIAQPLDAKGGEIKDLTPHELEVKEIDDAIFAAAPKRLYGPLKVIAQHKTIAPETNSGFFLFEVQSTVPARKVPLSKVSAALSKQLSTQRKNQSLASFVAAFRRKWTARTDCRPGYVIVENCKQFKSPKGSKPEDPYTL